MKRSLSRDKIIDEAFTLIDKYGLAVFSLRKLAIEFDVQVSSLYNHIRNEDDIIMEVGLRAIDMFTECIDNARGDLVRDEAAFATGDAFRMFVQEHPHLYDIIIGAKWSSASDIKAVNQKHVRPIVVLLKQYGIEDGDIQIHLMRMIRTVTHGFCSLEMHGAFRGVSGVSATESYHLMVQSVIDLMKKYGDENKAVNNEG